MNEGSGAVTVLVNDKVVPNTVPLIDNAPLTTVLRIVASSKICAGNGDLNSERPDYSDNCHMLVAASSLSTRCDPCVKYRKCLQKQLFRRQCSQTNRVAASSRVPHSTLSNAELLQRSRNLSAEVKQKNTEIQRLRSQLSASIKKHAIEVESQTSKLCNDIVNTHLCNFEENSIKKLFLEQQIKANSQVTSSAMRWHPSIVRWCLVLHNKSYSAYSYLRSSSALSLPSDRTLRDYIAYRPIETGTQTTEICNLVKDQQQQDVALCFDEMKVKSGLVYCPRSGLLTGYVDCLDADSLLDVTQTASDKLATHALAFQIRGLKSNLQSIVATYATSALNAEGLYNRFWETVANLEVAGFKVRAAVSDGAATNRKFYNLHHSDFPDDPITYRAINRFASDGRTLYFVSDTCHLVKTTRNCWERSGPKSHRHLTVS